MRAMSTAASVVRHTGGALAEAFLLALLIAVLLITLAPIAPIAAPGGELSGADTALAGRAKYSGTLWASPSTLQSGDYFDVFGCGYDVALGNVKLSFVAGAWGSPLDAEGCFTIAGIPALSGDTLAPGTYEIRALQKVRKRWIETGHAYVTVVP